MNRFTRLVFAGSTALLMVLWGRDAFPHNPITTTVLFNREIAAIVNAKCAQCHAPQGMAMSLQTWADARPWAQAIKEEVLAHHMPPWPAEHGYGTFANEGALTLREQEFLISWIDGGVPQGDGEPPAFFDHSAHWMLGEPDRALAPTDGAMAAAARAGRFTRLVVDSGLEHDTWVRGFDFKPEDKSVRVAFLSVLETGQYLGGWTPWFGTLQLPEQVAFKLPARSRIAVDLMYGATPPAAVSRPRLGLCFAPSASHPVSDIVLTSSSVHEGRAIAGQTLASARSLLGVRVDMTDGARSIELKARRADGSFVPLLWIKNFRQDWQTPYIFQKPVTLPPGSRVEAIARFESQATAPRVTVILSAY